VGGADQPIRSATHVIDVQGLPKDYTNPNSYRLGMMGVINEPIMFNAHTWHVQNICDYPWPYGAKQFDFVWCTQTLEDLRDPIGVCREMIRVGKSGYINCPSKFVELMRPLNQYLGADLYNGFWHHRWLISLEGKKLIFDQKTAFGFILDFSEFAKLIKTHPELCVTELYWDDSFEVEERFELDAKTEANSLIQYMQGIFKQYKDK